MRQFGVFVVVVLSLCGGLALCVVPPTVPCQPHETQPLLVTGSERLVAHFVMAQINSDVTTFGLGHSLDIVMSSPVDGLTWLQGTSSSLTYIYTPTSKMNNSLIEDPGRVSAGNVYGAAAPNNRNSVVSSGKAPAGTSAPGLDYVIVVFDNTAGDDILVPRVVHAGPTPFLDTQLVDVSGDGLAEVVFLVDDPSHPVGVLPNNGNGSFAPPVWIDTGGASVTTLLLAWVDSGYTFDLVWGGDGFIGVAFASPSPAGSVSFSPAANLTVNPALGRIRVLSFDVINSAFKTFVFVNDDDVFGFLNRPGSPLVFDTVISFQADVLGISDMKTVDYDSDGDIDIVVAAAGDGVAGWYINRRSEGISDPSAMFEPSLRTVTSTCLGCSAVVVTDIDGDSDIDMFVAAPDVNAVFLMFGTPLDIIQFETIVPRLVTPTSHRVLADLNNDAAVDFIFADMSKPTLQYGQNADGLGGLAPLIPVAGNANVSFDASVDVFDLDIDGNPDLVFTSAGDDVFNVAWGLDPDAAAPFPVGSWDITHSASDWGLFHLSAFAVWDLNADASPDLVVADRTGSLAYVLGPPTSDDLSTRRAAWAAAPAVRFVNGSLDPTLVLQVLEEDADLFVHGLELVDMDRDSLHDLVYWHGGPVSRVVWYKATPQSAPFFDTDNPHLILQPYYASYPSYIVARSNAPLTSMPAGPVSGLYDILIHDLDGIFGPDVLISFPQPPAMYVFYNDGTGTGWSNPATPVPNFGTHADTPGEVALFPRPGVQGSDRSFTFSGLQSGVTTFYEPFTFRQFIPNVLAAFSESAIYAIDVFDINMDGASDVLIVSSGIVAMLPGTTMWTSPIPLDVEEQVVDVATCGFTFDCIARAYVKLSQCSLNPLVLLPPGTYVGCPRTAFPIFKSAIFRGLGSRGDVIIDCSATPGPGILFEVVTPVSLTLESLTLVGLHVADPYTSAISTTVSGPSITLRDVTVTGASSPTAGAVVNVAYGGSLILEDVDISQVSAGRFGGSIVFVADGSVANTFNMTRVSISSSEALTGDGGAVFVTVQLRTTVTIALSDSIFDDNASPGGMGGALLVDASAQDAYAAVTLARCSFRGNSAWLGGGAVAVAGRVALAFVDSTVLEANTVAGVGGAVVAVSDRAASLGSLGVDDTWASSQMATSLVDPDLAVSFGPAPAGAFVVHANSARFGGAVGVCGGRLRVEADASAFSGTNTGSVGGNQVFGCDLAGGLEDGALVRVGSGDASTPPAALAWSTRGNGTATDASMTLIPGIVRGLDARPLALLDAYGGVLRDPWVRLSVAIPSLSAVQVLFVQSVEFAVGADGLASLEDLGVRVEAALPHTGEYRVFVMGQDAATELRGPLTISMCPPGYGLAQASPTACRLCGKGSYSSAYDVEVCRQCDADGFTDNPGSSVCTFCLPGSRRVARNTSDALEGTTCACDVGLYAPDRAVPGVCVACPDGAICDGMFAWPRAKPGYYDVSAQPGSTAPDFQRCRIDAACTGSNNCASGSQGYMCLSCKADHYRNSAGGCTECSPVLGVVIVLFFVVSAVGALGSGALMWWRLPRVEAALEMAASESRASLRYSRVPHSIVALILFLQIVSVVGSIPLGWPSSLATFLQVFDVLNLDPSVVANECYLGSFLTRYILGLLWPAVLAGLFLLGMVSAPWALSSLRTVSLWTGLRVLVAHFGVVVYFPLVRLSVAWLDCARLPDGRYVLDADPMTECYRGSWWGAAFVGLLGLALYVVALPLASWWILKSSRSSLWSAPTLATVGPLYKLYRSWAYWGSVLVLARSAVLGVVFAFSSHAQTLLFLMLLALFATSSLAYLRVSPHYWPPYNTLHAYLEASLAALVVIGYSYFTDVFPNDAARIFFAVLTVGLVCGVVVGVLVTGLREGLRVRNLKSSVVVLDNGDILGVREAWFWDLVSRDIYDWEDDAFRSLVQAHDPHVVMGVTSSADALGTR